MRDETSPPRESKTVRQSKLSTQYQVIPRDANAEGVLHGGTLMFHIDSVATMCAFRHARCSIATVKVQRLDFFEPVFTGNILLLHASVNAAFRSSMEVGVRVEAEHPHTGLVRHVASAFLTFVGVDDHGIPRHVPRITPESAQERTRMAQAAQRAAFGKLQRAAGMPARLLTFQMWSEPLVRLALPANAPFPWEVIPDFLHLSAAGSGVVCFVPERDVPETLREQGTERYTCFELVTPSLPHPQWRMGNCVALLGAGRIRALSLMHKLRNYVLVPEGEREKAQRHLSRAGHTIAPHSFR